MKSRIPLTCFVIYFCFRLPVPALSTPLMFPTEDNETENALFDPDQQQVAPLIKHIYEFPQILNLIPILLRGRRTVPITERKACEIMAFYDYSFVAKYNHDQAQANTAIKAYFRELNRYFYPRHFTQPVTNETFTGYGFLLRGTKFAKELRFGFPIASKAKMKNEMLSKLKPIASKFPCAVILFTNAKIGIGRGESVNAFSYTGTMCFGEHMISNACSASDPYPCLNYYNMAAISASECTAQIDQPDAFCLKILLHELLHLLDVRHDDAQDTNRAYVMNRYNKYNDPPQLLLSTQSEKQIAQRLQLIHRNASECFQQFPPGWADELGLGPQPSQEVNIGTLVLSILILFVSMLLAIVALYFCLRYRRQIRRRFLSNIVSPIQEALVACFGSNQERVGIASHNVRQETVQLNGVNS